MSLEDLFLYPSRFTLGDVLCYARDNILTYGECAQLIEDQLLKKYQLNLDIFEHLYKKSADFKEYCLQLIEWEQEHN